MCKTKDVHVSRVYKFERYAPLENVYVQTAGSSPDVTALAFTVQAFLVLRPLLPSVPPSTPPDDRSLKRTVQPIVRRCLVSSTRERADVQIAIHTGMPGPRMEAPLSVCLTCSGTPTCSCFCCFGHASFCPPYKSPSCNPTCLFTLNKNPTEESFSSRSLNSLQHPSDQSSSSLFRMSTQQQQLQNVITCYSTISRKNIC